MTPESYSSTSLLLRIADWVLQTGNYRLSTEYCVLITAVCRLLYFRQLSDINRIL